MSNKEKYTNIFRDIFNVDEALLNTSFTFKDVEKWDSLTHLTLITELEETFGIMFDTEDILHYESFDNGMKLLIKYGVDFEES